MTMHVGDRVTVRFGRYDDPLPLDIEMILHPHAVIVAVEPGPSYVVGHPPAAGRHGPYTADRLMPGWPGWAAAR